MFDFLCQIQLFVQAIFLPLFFWYFFKDVSQNKNLHIGNELLKKNRKWNLTNKNFLSFWHSCAEPGYTSLCVNIKMWANISSAIIFLFQDVVFISFSLFLVNLKHTTDSLLGEFKINYLYKIDTRIKHTD